MLGLRPAATPPSLFLAAESLVAGATYVCRCDERSRRTRADVNTTPSGAGSVAPSFLRWYAPVALVIVALDLRPGLITIGPVLPAIRTGLALTPADVGILTALPILALGLASAVAFRVGKLVGWSGGLIVAMAFDGCGIALRIAGGERELFAGAALLGAGIGLGNVFVPTLVKARFPNHVGLAMGLYTLSLTLGALVGVDVSTALTILHVSWRSVLAFWAIPAFAAAVLSAPLLFDNARPTARAPGSANVWTSGVAWSVTAFMGLQSGLFYSIAQWIAILLALRGVDLVAVGWDLQAFYVMQLFAALALPIVLTRARRQDLIAAALAAGIGVEALALLYAPTSAGLLVSGLLGATIGGIFAVALTFQVIRARTPDSAAQLAAMAQSVGYVIASVGPFVLGLVSKWPDPRFASAVWLAALALATVVAGLAAGRPRFVDDRRATRDPLAASSTP